MTTKERYQSACSVESHEGLLWCLDEIGNTLEKLDKEHPDSRAKTPPMMWPEWIGCVVAQARAQAIEECAVLVEAVGCMDGCEPEINEHWEECPLEIAGKLRALLAPRNTAPNIAPSRPPEEAE